jgi:carboxymethylenebutenolidase
MGARGTLLSIKWRYVMNNFQSYLAEEFAEDYIEGRLTRRDAIKMIASVTGSALLANSILAGCMPRQASPAMTATDTMAVTEPATIPVQETANPNDILIQFGTTDFPDATGVATLKGYLAWPSGQGRFPVILVCHENRGLTAHIQDVTRRLARAGYVALAVDLLSRSGGSASLNAADIPGILGNISPDQFAQDFTSGWHFLQGQEYAQTDRLGMVGFCFGGGVTWLVATRLPALKAAVPFYGPPPDVAEVPKIQAAVLAIYGGLDQRITQTAPTIEAAMKQNNKIFEKVIYPNADHAFFNDTGTRYNAEAAHDAWQRTLAWFKKYV